MHSLNSNSRQCKAFAYQPPRREERLDVSELRRLGPEVQPGQIVAATDDVEVRRPERRSKLYIRTARVATREGFRYLSGQGDAVLDQLYLLLLLCGGLGSWVTLLGDGARWIRKFFTERLAAFTHKELILAKAPSPASGCHCLTQDLGAPVICCAVHDFSPISGISAAISFVQLQQSGSYFFQRNYGSM